jgi:hypothetical protein
MGGLPEPSPPSSPSSPGTFASLADGGGRAPDAIVSSLCCALTKGYARDVIPRLSEVPSSESFQVKRYARGDGSELAQSFQGSILRRSKQSNWANWLQIPIPWPNSVHPNTTLVCLQFLDNVPSANVIVSYILIFFMSHMYLQKP